MRALNLMLAAMHAWLTWHDEQPWASALKLACMVRNFAPPFLPTPHLNPKPWHSAAYLSLLTEF